VKILSRNYIFAVTAAAVLAFALTAGSTQGGAQQQRDAKSDKAAPPTPRWPDGKPIMGAIPGQGPSLWGRALFLESGERFRPPGAWDGLRLSREEQAGLGERFRVLGELAEVPFQPWARAVAEQRWFDQAEPTARCKPSGATGTFVSAASWEFVEARDMQRFYVMDHEVGASYRIIYVDGRAFPEKITPTYHGYSIGHWEGDTLVVETRGFNEKFWMDRGTPNTEQLKLIERFTRVDLNTMHYQATIDDPGALTRPFTTRLVAWTLQPGVESYEYICQDHNVEQEILAGRTQQEADYSRFFVP
jgi:hypothetical protein